MGVAGLSHGRGERWGGAAGDRDADGGLVADSVVAKLQVERVVDATLLVVGEPRYVDVAVGDVVEDRDVGPGWRLLLPVKLGEELPLLALLGHGGCEPVLDAVAPRLVDVGVSGRLEPLELVDQVLLPAAEVFDLRREFRRAGGQLGVATGGAAGRGGGEVGLAAGAEDALGEERASGWMSWSSAIMAAGGWSLNQGRWAWLLAFGLHR
jgi:hypothetical protein